jgi:hypothetical protein
MNQNNILSMVYLSNIILYMCKLKNRTLFTFFVENDFEWKGKVYSNTICREFWGTQKLWYFPAIIEIDER